MKVALAISVVCMLAPALAAAAPVGVVHADLRLAYIDPGAGSFLIQALVAAAAGIAVAVRFYWKRIRAFVGLAVRDEEEDELPSAGDSSRE